VDKLLTFFFDRTTRARCDIALLAVAFSLPLFQLLGRYPLLEPDEGRYSEIPREMLERGDFITPTLNYVKYFEKPPLLYWLNALSFSIFGQNEFAARFPCALAGLLTIILTYWLGRKLFNRQVGLMAAVILGTSSGFVAQARINLTDMPLTFCLTLCLGSFILALRDSENSRTLFYTFYAGAAMSVLAKGLIGILFPGVIIFLFMLACKRWDLLKKMRLPTGSILFLLIAAPWFVMVSLRNPEFARFFFVHEHFERFLTTAHRRYKPFWYFVPVLAGTMFPWSIFIPAALRHAWQNRKGNDREIITFLAIWAGFIFLFFSKSNSKLMPYILPVLPPLAILTANLCTGALGRWNGPIKTHAKCLTALLMIIGIALPIYPLLATKQDFPLSGAILLGTIFVCQAGLAWHLIKRADALFFFMVVAFGSLLSTVIAGHIAYSQLAERKTSKSLALKIKSLATPETVVASFGYDQTLPFYSRRRTVVVGNRGELEFGSKQGNQTEWFLDSEAFYREWDGGKRVFALLPPKGLEELVKNTKTPPTVIEQKRRKMLVTNR